MSKTAIERQLELEDEAAGLGMQKYRKMINEAKQKGTEHTLPPVMSLIDRVITPVSLAIDTWVKDVLQDKRNRRAQIARFYEAWDADQLAYITLRHMFAGVSGKNRLQRVALDITATLEDELSYTMLKEKAPGLYRKIARQTARSSSYRHRRAVMQVAASRAGYDWQKPFTPEYRAKIGIILIDLAIQATGLMETALVPSAKNKSVMQLVPTDKLMDWLEKQHARFELLNPVQMPMLCRPDDWTTPFNGGFLNKSNQRLSLVKTDNRQYLDDLATRDLAEVYTAINSLQRTAWRINKGVFEVMREVWERGGNLGGLPHRDPEPLPAKPVDIDTNEEALKAWKRQAARIYEHNATMISKRVSVSSKLALAERYLDEDEFFYVYQMDWRGRVYPAITGSMHPQGDDSGKALLQFAEGKPLGESGAYWLAVHIANLFGVDKVSFDERVAWVEENTEALLDSASRPLEGERFWTTADKPYCALAACFEWMGFILQGEEYVSHLPIAMDGSCNGLQNFSAMLKDDIGGKAVNLVPDEKPQDIYMEVAKVVEEKVNSDNSDLAKAWRGKVTRGLVKRPVMTLPYGATRIGMRDQLDDHLKKCKEAGKMDQLPAQEDWFPHCQWMAGVIYDSIGEVVVAARAAMDWLQDVAKIAATDGLPLHWTTPTGFPVLQRYVKSVNKLVDCQLERKRIRVRINERTPKIDRRGMAQGISPNYVHSLDASHMMKTVQYCAERGIKSFAMIHDSYGTHAADAELMFYLLRKAFVDIYSEDVLGDFKAEIERQLPDELVMKLPEVPPTGSLELDAVMESQYFFA